MDIAITGASGLIGTSLRTFLTTQGHRVLRVVRGDDRAADAIGWDIHAGTIDAAGLEGIDAVVHLAGAGIGDKRWSDDRKREIRESRVKGTALLAETLTELKKPPSVWLSGSAIGYYGDRGSDVLDESEPAGHDFLADVCVQWEAATGPAEAAGIRVAHLRTGIVLSSAGGALKKQLPLFKFGIGGPIAGGGQYWSWISIDDTVRAISFLLGAEVAGPVDLTAPEPVTQKEFAKTLGSVLHRPSFLPIPKFGPALLLGSGLADALLDTSARVLPTVLEGAGYHFLHRDVRTALAAVLDKEAEIA
ncbi:MAG TPA: TIGR01777 family oxidoreductase [Acidimicrobiales bacterium]|nr:TIGR01777 family oxidoreductase [Acidimicrobiales bacterium]